MISFQKSHLKFNLIILVLLVLMCSSTFADEKVVDQWFNDMVVYDNKLIFVGHFDVPGVPADTPVYNVPLAAWNGISWESMHNDFLGLMKTATVYNNKLIVGATSIAFNEQYGNTALMQWDGVSWEMAGDIPLNTHLNDVIEYDNMLIVAGFHFKDANENDIYGLIAVDSNNHTITLGSGSLGADYSTNTNNAVFSLAVYDGKLYAGGIFNYMDSLNIPKIAVYDGVQWQAVPGSNPLVNSVTAMAVYNNKLIVGGNFNNYSEHIMSFDGTTWSSLEGGDVNGSIESLTATPEFLVASGLFSQAGSAFANNIALWNGSCWGELGNGTNGKVLSSAYFLDDYYYAGVFDEGDEFIASSSAARYSEIATPCACCRGTRGNVDNDIDDIVDISDLVSLVDFMFTNGQEPPCLVEGNIDADPENITDVSDLVFLVDFMFTDGPAPASCQ